MVDRIRSPAFLDALSWDVRERHISRASLFVDACQCAQDVLCAHLGRPSKDLQDRRQAPGRKEGD